MGLFFKNGSVRRRGITKKMISLSLLTRGTVHAAAVCSLRERTAAEEGTSSEEDRGDVKYKKKERRGGQSRLGFHKSKRIDSEVSDRLDFERGYN